MKSQRSRIGSRVWLPPVVIVGVAVAAAVALFALASAGTGSTAANTVTDCDTTLASDAHSGAEYIHVKDITGCDTDDWILISQGEAAEECRQISYPAAPLLYLTELLDNENSEGDSVVEVGACPTPTPTATPTPTPTATATATPTPPHGLTRTLVWSPGWHNETWSGSSTPEEVFACAAGKYAAAYRYVDGGLEHYFPDRPDISNMNPLDQYAAFLILSTQPVTCTMPVASASGATRTLQWGPGWHNEGWSGADGTAPQDVFACAGSNYAAAYRLVNGNWERYFPGRPDISNMGPLNKYDAFLILITAPVSCTMAIAPTPGPAPSGRIAFQSNRLEGGVYAMNSDGSGQTRLTVSADMPAWSPDGSKIAFSTRRDSLGDESNSEIYVMNADGSSQTRLTNDPAVDYMPAWSPDGRRIAFASDRDHSSSFDIYVMNADGTGQTRLTNNAAADWFPSWSPDGSRIAFASKRDDAPGGEIYVMNADGSGQTRITNNTANDSSPALSPDGSRIAFTSDDEIYVMNADGSGQTRLTNNSASDLYLAWSPDGSRIAFTSGRDGNLEIYVMNADGSGQANLSNNPARDLWPTWSP